MKSLDIRIILPKDFPSITSDFAEIKGVLPSKCNTMLSVLNWRFYDNPLGQGIFAGAFSGAKLVATAGITVKSFAIKGTPVMGAEIGDTITHPDFRGMGAFSSLVRYLLKAAAEKGFHIIYGTPNQMSGQIYLNKLDFVPLFHWDTLARPINWNCLGVLAGTPGKIAGSVLGPVCNLLLPLKLGEYQYSVDENMHPDLKSFLTQACYNCECSIDRTPNYIRWRFNRPDRQYFQIYLRDKNGELRGWAVIGYVTEGDIRFSHVRIGDFWITPKKRGVLKALLAAIMIEGKRKGVDMICAVCRTKKTSNIFKSLGFFAKPSIMPLIAIAPIGYDLKQFEKWQYRDSDADMF